MCDNHHHNSCCQHSFYHQYMQEHAAMMQWIQHLHSNVNMQGTHNINQTYQGNFHRPQIESKYRDYNSYNGSSSSSYDNSSSETTSSSESDATSLEDEYDEEDESDCEYEFNVEAILEMRRAKEDLKKEESSDSSSLVMIEPAEEFEFVEFGTKQEIGSKKSVMYDGSRNRYEELKYEKELKQHLYGEKFTTIAGLETAMSLTYERLCDIHQPPFWPVYPLRLTSSAK